MVLSLLLLPMLLLLHLLLLQLLLLLLCRERGRHGEMRRGSDGLEGKWSPRDGTEVHQRASHWTAQRR